VATGKTQADGTPEMLVLVTNRLDLAAELVALAYRYRWAVEISQPHYDSSESLYLTAA